MEYKKENGTLILGSVEEMRMFANGHITIRTYTLESIEINHRNTKSAECIADTLFQKVSRYLQNPANTEASPEDVEKVCLKYIPQKARTEFTKEIRKEIPLEERK